MVLKSFGWAAALSCFASLAMLVHVEGSKAAAPLWERESYWLTEMVMPPVTGIFCFLFAFPACLFVFWMLREMRKARR